MDAIRISATEIDALRYYLSAEEGELAELLAQLRKELPQTAAMRAGTAFHAALEVAETGNEFPEMEADGYTFDMRADGEISLPPIRELKATRDYMIRSTLVTLVGKVDAIDGRTIIDHKLTGRYDAERFLGSVQWRAYLEIFGANVFLWNIFEGRETEPQRYTITGLHRLTAHRYPGIEADLQREISRFVDFARTHLPERFTPREPLPFEMLSIG